MIYFIVALLIAMGVALLVMALRDKIMVMGIIEGVVCFVAAIWLLFAALPKQVVGTCDVCKENKKLYQCVIDSQYPDVIIEDHMCKECATEYEKLFHERQRAGEFEGAKYVQNKYYGEAYKR